jgi:hypothetical protein
MKAMYITFIRSILEYGAVLFMGARDCHLGKLDALQRSAQKLGGFEVESLQSRREAAAISFALKLLDGDCRPDLQQFAPHLISGHYVKHEHDTQHKLHGIQIQPLELSTKPLDIFKRSFFGQLPRIWAKLPQEILKIGESKAWRKVSKSCKNHIKQL